MGGKTYDNLRYQIFIKVFVGAKIWPIFSDTLNLVSSLNLVTRLKLSGGFNILNLIN